MFDAHNHFTKENSIFKTAELLPENLNDNYDIRCVYTSEIGLDKRFTDRFPMEKQTKCLREFLEYANKNDIPVSLHCVHSTDLMLDILQQKRPRHALWHGFNGSPETAEILYKLGVVISIGPKFNKDICSIYKVNPLITLESDYTGTNVEEHNRIIENMYSKISKELNLTPGELEVIAKNATAAFTN